MKSTHSTNSLTSGEWSPRATGRTDLAKYPSGVKILENWLINQLGGALYRPGSKYIASTKSDGAARLFPFQFSADQDYVVEAGDLYFRLYSNSANIISNTTNLTKLLCSFDSANDGQDEFTDIGNTGHIITNEVTVAISAAQKKFGNASLILDGDSDFLTVPDHANWDIQTNFTIDFWVKHSDHVGTEAYLEQYVDGTNYWVLEHVHGTGLHFQVDGGGADINISGGEIIDTDWHHIALCKVGSEVGIYKDGVQVAFGSAACTTAFADLLSIGARIDPTNYFEGYMDDVRITHANSFTAAPVVGLTDTITEPTAAHTSDANTKLLLPCDSLDASSSVHIISLGGTANLDTGAKKWGTASLLLDGDSDYAQTPDHVDFDIVKSADDSWTVDFWVKFTDHVGYENIFYFNESPAYNDGWLIRHFHSSGWQFYVQTGGVAQINLIGGGEIADTDWHHVAMCKVADKYAFYVDGTQVNYIQDSGTDTFDAILYIGVAVSSSYFDGSLDDVRIINSNAFTASPDAGLSDTIVIPTSAHTASPTTQTEITTPYVLADVFDLQMAQSNDVMYIVHPDYAPRKLSRTGASAFTLSLVPFVRGPLMDTNITATTITPSADTGAGVTLTASTAIFESGHIGALYRVKDGMAKITAYTSTTVVTADVQAEPDGSAGDLNTGPGATADWAEGAFSDVRGYPSAITFHEQRLHYANTTTEPQKIWGSYIGAYDSFDTTATTDNYSTTFAIATDQRNAIRWLASNKNFLSIGTTGGTFSASGGTDSVIVPTSIQIDRDTNYGVANMQPKRISSLLYYVQRDLRKLRELSFTFDQNIIKAADMTLLAEHILRDGDGVVQIDSQQSPNDRMWMVLDNGQLAVLTRNPEQEVTGWCRVVAGTDSVQAGKYESVAVIPKSEEEDQVWVVVNRTVGAATKRFIEVFNTETFDDDWDAVRVDSSLTLDSPITITGATKANPVVVTAASHGFTNTDQIKIDNVVGMTELNGNTYFVASKTDDTFELQSAVGTDVSGTAYTTYISGGEVREMVTAISGLDHLEGETVSVQTDGYLPTTATYVVAAGAITLSEAAAVVHAGLPYTGTIQLLKLSDGSPTGTGQTRMRRIFNIALRLYRSQGLSIGRTSSTLDNLNYTDEADSEALVTKDIAQPFQTTWDRADEIIIKQTSPLPATILAIVLRSETTEG